MHPAKREVRLKNEFQVRDFLFAAISSALAESNSNLRENFSAEPAAEPEFSAVPKPALTPASEAEIPAPRLGNHETAQAAERDPAPARGFSKPLSVAEKPAFSPAVSDEQKPPVREIPALAPVGRGVSERADAPQKSAIAAVAAEWRYIGCLKKRFAIFETAKGLVLMSVSAALKRVRYEEILAGLRGGKVVSQNLLIPLPLKFERGDDEYFSANRKAFETCGFVVEDFGKSKYGDIENFVRDFVEIAREENRALRKSALSDENFARSLVVRYGAADFTCTETTATELLAKLLSGNSGASSPDGKPTLKEISDAEILRMFQM